MDRIIIETHNYKDIFELCLESKHTHEMCAIIGMPGAGKTTALVDFTTANNKSFYVRVRKSMSTKDFYRELLYEVTNESHPYELSVHVLINKLCYVLNRSKSNLIIIDEAGKFTSGQLEYIHELRDLTDKSTGIILAGPEYFLDNLLKWKQKGVVGIPELYRRISQFKQLSQVALEETMTICKNYNITNRKEINRIHSRIESFNDLYLEIRHTLNLKQASN